ncbi:hypothetical protein ACS0TY_013050 [Phlomoides rotata]
MYYLIISVKFNRKYFRQQLIEQSNEFYNFIRCARWVPMGLCQARSALSVSDDLLPLCQSASRASSACVLISQGWIQIRKEDGEGEHCDSDSTLCLIGKVLTNKTFNVFGFLSPICRVSNREPWHFDKNVILLKELDSGEQSSTVLFSTVTFWVRLYDLPMVARNSRSIEKIGGCIGDVVEIDQASLNGVARSIRIKAKIDYSKPLRSGITLELKDSKQVWVNFKYERLPSFCYLCGVLGHMHRECDLAEGGDNLDGIPKDSLLFR